MSNTFKTALLLGALSALLLFIGESLGGAQGLVVGFLFAVVANFASYWFSDTIVLKMYRAAEVGPEHRLYRSVQRLAARAGLPQPRCYVIPDRSPNAFATGRSPEHAAVAATEGILQILDDDELDGVLAHELAHVKHRDILTSSVAATLAAAIMMVSRFAMFFGGGRDDRRDGQPHCARRDDHPRSDCGDADSGSDFAVARVRRRRRRRVDCGVAERARQRASEDRDGLAYRADGRQPRDGTHVHHQAVFSRRSDGSVQHASADQRARRRAAAPAIVGRSFQDRPARDIRQSQANPTCSASTSIPPDEWARVEAVEASSRCASP